MRNSGSGDDEHLDASRWDRRQVLARGLAIAGGGLAVGGGSGLGMRPAPAAAAAGPADQGDGQGLEWLMDMVHHNPGEALTETAFTDPRTLAAYGHGAQVVNEFRPPHTAITYDSFDQDIFPAGSEARQWVEDNAASIEARIDQIHAAGLRAFYFTDIIVLPKRIVEIYGDQITDSEGRISLDRELTQRLHRILLAEVFERFPHLDGLVVRTGETYLSNVPHHTGNNPITRGAASHRILLDILRDEVCVKREKLLFYRTWSFDGFHTDPAYYREVTDSIEPHPKLYFSIKHTKGDYFRTIAFNPTLTIGRHPQIVEVQCQREYEGKGAHPNYVAAGVIDGFEEYGDAPGPKCLDDIRDHPNIHGIWTWSRGGGWRGPYLRDEMWCELNFGVLSRWAKDPQRGERAIFEEYAIRLGLSGAERGRFRELALASAAGVLRGHYGLAFPVKRLTWMRDQYLGGSDKDLTGDFQRFSDAGVVEKVLAEKAEAVRIWQRIVRLADRIDPKEHAGHLRVSSRYGLLLHEILYHGWGVTLTGFAGDQTGDYDKDAIRAHLREYDAAWDEFRRLGDHPLCATLYEPQSFGPENPDGTHDGDPDHGMRQSVDRYRDI